MSDKSKANSKINLFAVTMADIFQKCFERAGIPCSDGRPAERWPARLIRAMENDLTIGSLKTVQDLAFEGYLRDRYRRVCEMMDQGKKYNRLNYYQYNIAPLLEYARVADAEMLDAIWGEKQGRGTVAADNIATLPVICTGKPFRRLDILRVPDDYGYMNFHKKGCEFCGEATKVTLTHEQLQSAGEFTMPGAPHALWVRITFLNDGHTTTLYFAEVCQLSGELKLRPPKYLLSLLGSI